jgi:amino acid transporter
MGFCSAMTLAFATIFSLVSIALLAIAFSTDNWVTISVKREQLKDLDEFKDGDLVNESPLYFTRTRGLFRECFPGEKSDDPEKTSAPLGDLVELYMSPVETYCRNLDYYIPDEGRSKQLTGEEMVRIHMGRAMIALFIVGFFFICVSFIAGARGCWKTSPTNITASAVLMLVACMFSAAGMGLWHGVEHWEMNKINVETDTELFVKSWPESLRERTEFKYDWSYIVSWIGVGLELLAAILFSLAAVCIRTDKEREEAMNMQYLMPVYQQQKQQPYPGPYGYAAYPGPYYGSQYGPY